MFLLLLDLIIVVLIIGLSWWFFWTFFILSCIVWIITGTISLTIWYKRRKPVIETLNTDDADKLAVYQMMHDEDNPDNFEISEKISIRVGEPGSERTLIRILRGYGTETNEDRVVIINLETKETSMLIEPKEEKIWELATKISKRQPEVVVREEIGGGFDSYGRPIPSKVRITTPTREQIKEKEEMEKAEEEQAF